jgi:hypothetical protein
MSAVPASDIVDAMRLTPRWRKAVLTLHVATAVGWLGVDLVLLTLGVSGLVGADPDVVYPAQSLVGRVLFVPLSALVWLVGVVNALFTPWRLFRHWWVLVKLLLTTLMLVLVVVLLYPALTQAGELAGAMEFADRVNLVVAPSVSSSLLITATVLSTYKPWGRVRRVTPA